MIMTNWVLKCDRVGRWFDKVQVQKRQSTATLLLVDIRDKLVAIIFRRSCHRGDVMPVRVMMHPNFPFMCEEMERRMTQEAPFERFKSCQSFVSGGFLTKGKKKMRKKGGLGTWSIQFDILSPLEKQWRVSWASHIDQHPPFIEPFEVGGNWSAVNQSAVLHWQKYKERKKAIQ